jgi:hypothetical protein
MNIIINGWEYLTEINPINMPVEQKIQNNYLLEYNLAYHMFLKEMCIDINDLNLIKNNNSETKYKYIFDISTENDIINNNSEFPIKFYKSKFINYKNKKLKIDLINYYKPLGFYVKGPFELINGSNVNKYYIELFWHKD